MNAVELKVLEVKQPEVLFNEQEIGNYLAGVLEKYDGLVFTDDTVKDCKATVTELNKMIKSVDAFRLKYKKELSEPITEFEKKCKTLMAQIEGVQEPLKLQADNFEIKRRTDRKAEVEGFIEEVLGIVKLESKYADKLILKDEWLNVSLTNPKVKKAIMDEAQILLSEQKSYYDKLELVATKCEVFSLRLGLQIPLTPDSFYYMLDTHDGPAIEERIKNTAERQSETEKQAIERIRKEEEAKAQAQAQVQIDQVKAESDVKVAEALEVASTVTQSVEQFIPVEKQEKDPIYRANYTVRGSKAQLEALVNYMTASGIEFIKN